MFIGVILASKYQLYPSYSTIRIKKNLAQNILADYPFFFLKFFLFQIFFFQHFFLIFFCNFLLIINFFCKFVLTTKHINTSKPIHTYTNCDIQLLTFTYLLFVPKSEPFLSYDLMISILLNTIPYFYLRDREKKYTSS